MCMVLIVYSDAFFLFFIIKIKYISNFLTQNVVQNLVSLAPEQANYIFITWKSHAVSISCSESSRIYAKMQFMPCRMYFSWPRGKNHTKFAYWLLICLVDNPSTIAQLIERQPFLTSLKQAPLVKILHEFESHVRHLPVYRMTLDVALAPIALYL